MQSAINAAVLSPVAVNIGAQTADSPTIKSGNGASYLTCINVVGAILISSLVTLFLRDESLQLTHDNLSTPIPLAILIIGVGLLVVNNYDTQQNERQCDALINQTKNDLHAAVNTGNVSEATRLTKQYIDLKEQDWTSQSTPIIAKLYQGDRQELKKTEAYLLAVESIESARSALKKKAKIAQPKHFLTTRDQYDQACNKRTAVLSQLNSEWDRVHYPVYN